MLAKFCTLSDNGGAETDGRQQPQTARGCMMHVRRARREDKKAFVRQAEAFFDVLPMPTRVNFDKHGFAALYDQKLESDDVAFWVVELDDKVVGICGAIISPIYYSPKNMTAQELFWWIEPEARGTTASKQMMFEMQSWAEQAGASQFSMIALENDRSKTMERVYSRNGFTPIERTFTKELRYGH